MGVFRQIILSQVNTHESARHFFGAPLFAGHFENKEAVGKLFTLLYFFFIECMEKCHAANDKRKPWHKLWWYLFILQVARQRRGNEKKKVSHNSIFLA